MFSSAVIVFREVLEAALVITIVLAATQGVLNRARWILGGIFAGVLGACLVAAAAEQIAMAFDGIGQELLNAGILSAAVLMLAWHNIWMSRHAKELVSHLKQVGSNVASGQLPLYVLATAVGLAVLREGAEVVLFLYGIAAGGSDPLSMMSGGLLGLAGGAAMGALIYFGLLRIPTHKLFSVTSWMILLLASGMAASAAGYLAQVGWLPSQRPLWNSSALLSERSVPGQLMHILVGYQERPTAVQLAAYLATLASIAFGMYLVRPRLQKPTP
ncbi:FTR1 family protein [Gallaecimonas kandeliae]|uniref:FTR1 family iron permease n=1 Tax=Gallaecimonas kandeliae TaxID=3029055 RepID=UPI00264A2EBC|nr:FTR1 family protein [Gallaecimonas kandeliae]WKE65178.1 FTR1 family protein [Gallaecimonas kandeliae]